MLSLASSGGAAGVGGGAAIDDAMQNGATPLYIACKQGPLEVAKLLSSYGATPEAVAHSRGHADLAAWLVASRGWTPLAHIESLTATRTLSLLRSGASLHEGEYRVRFQVCSIVCQLAA